MIGNKENSSKKKGDRFIPTEIRSCAFLVEQPVLETDSSKSNYEEFLEKSILSNVDSNMSHKLMSFGRATGQNSIIKGVKNNAEKTYNKENTEKKPRKVNKKPYKIL